MLYDYMVRHGDPAKIPAAFWDTRVCPEFVPPVGVFRAWYGGCGAVEEDHGSIRQCTAVARTAVWSSHEGRLVRHPAKDLWTVVDGIGYEPGAEPPEFAAMNLRYRELERAWYEAWHRRRGELLRSGQSMRFVPDGLAFEKRDRAATVDRYHREHQSPSDLPDWFFLTDECPPFVPPTGVFRFEYGSQFIDPRSGETHTWIRSSAGWTQLIGEPAVTFIPADERHHSVAGAYPEGTMPAKSVPANQRWDLALLEWEEEWRRRRDFYRAGAAE